MIIVNAKQAALAFPLDNGQLMQINSGDVSIPFMPSRAVIGSLLTLGTPEEIGIVLTNSYELSIISDLTGALAYLHDSVDAAKNVLFNGFKAPVAPTVITEVEYQKVCGARDEALKKAAELEKKVNDLMHRMSQSSSEQSKKELDLRNQELTKANDRINELTSQLDEIKFSVADKEKEITRANEAAKSAQYELVELQKKMDASVTENADVENVRAEMQEKIDADEKKNADWERDFDELKKSYNEIQAAYESSESALKEANAKIEGLSAPKDAEPIDREAIAEGSQLVADLRKQLEANVTEITQLKADGAKLVDGYNKAKSGLLTVMDKFHINYVDGDYVMEH